MNNSFFIFTFNFFLIASIDHESPFIPTFCNCLIFHRAKIQKCVDEASKLLYIHCIKVHF